MNDVLENQLSMYQKVQGHAVIHNALLSTIPAIATLHTELNGYVTTILNTAGAATADITGYTVDKQNKRNEFNIAILKISTAYAAANYLTGNNKAAERFDLSPAALNSLRDNDLYTYAQDLNAIATPATATLLPFGVVGADFTALTTKAAEYLALIQAPKIQIGERAAKLITLQATFDKVNDLLKQRLDNVMKVFLIPQPTMYNAYILARGIDDTSTPTAPDYEGSINPNATLEIANIPYLASRSIVINNTGTVPLTIALSALNNMIQGNPLVVAPGATGNYRSDTLNPLPANFILLQNNTPSAGSYEIRLLE